MVGISYWDEENSKKLREDIVKVFNSRGGKEKYWDNVPLTVCKKDFKIEVRDCEKADVTEIDNFSELCILDPSYKNYPQKQGFNRKLTVILHLFDVFMRCNYECKNIC